MVRESTGKWDRGRLTYLSGEHSLTNWSQTSPDWRRPESGAAPSRAPIVVLQPDDVVLAGVGTELHLHDHQLLVLCVGDAVLRSLRDIDVPARRYHGLDVVQDAGRRALTTTQCSERCACVWYDIRRYGST